MNLDKSIYRSARTLLDVSRQRGLFDVVVKDLREICDAMSVDAELARVLADRRIPGDQRMALLDQLWGHGRVCALTLEFLRRMENGHLLEHLPLMLKRLEGWHEEAHGRMHAQVTSARSFTHEQSEKLAGHLSRMFNRKVSVTWQVDPALLAGYRVRAAGRVYDFTGRARLQQIRRHWTGAA